MAFFRTGWRILAALLSQAVFLLLAALLVLFFWWSRSLRWRLASFWGRIWAQVGCRVLNIHIHLQGQPTLSSPHLIVANHIGLPDIFIIGALFRGFFVAKGDVRHWPLLGWMTQVGGSVFVDRSRRQATGHMVRAIQDRLESGYNVILFPEGGAMDGTRIEPFKTPGFEAALRAACPVQPVVLVYPEPSRSTVVCWRNVPFSSHLWNLLLHPRLEVTVHLLPALDGYEKRRNLAQAAHDAMTAAYSG